MPYNWLHHATLGAIALILMAGSPAMAQNQVCELLPGARSAAQVIVAGEERIHVSGPARFVCPDDVVLQADSAVGIQGLGEVELIGNVFFQDSVKTLNAGWARYLKSDDRLLAREKVDLVDRKGGSRIRGDEVEYLPANSDRPRSEAIVQGRPNALLHRGQEAAAMTPADSLDEPIEIDADIMRIHGETEFHALGRVEIRSGEITGSAHEGEFNQLKQTILLSGEAHLRGEGYELDGDRIRVLLDERELKEVIAQHRAVLRAEDVEVEGAELQIYFEGEELQRLIALREADHQDQTGVPAPTTSIGAQPVVTAQEFRLSADSIDLLAPGQRLDRVIAVGSASGVRATDSLDIGLPEVIARDWLVGDTITALFTAVEREPSADSTKLVADSGSRTALERLVATGEGGRARSLYRIREKGAEHASPSANYLVAERITLIMREGEVSDVEADGPLQGMHLQPGATKRPAVEQASTRKGTHTRTRNEQN